MANDELKFDSAFEGGNGRFFSLAGENSYTFELLPEGEAGVRQWFYFAIEGAQGRTLTLQLLETQATSVPSHFDRCRPVVSNDGGKTWSRIDKPGLHDRERNVFSFEVKVDSPRFLVAYHYPYTYTEACRKIATWSTHRNVTTLSIGRSVDGRDIELLRVTDGSATGVGKHGAWICARQHSAESPASFMLEGFMDFVLSADNRAEVLRLHSVLSVVPMINPDGVFRGHYRLNSKGVNLNRVWHSPSAETSPEIQAVTQAIATSTRYGNPFDVFIDFHADSSAHEHYAFHSGHGLEPENYKRRGKYYGDLTRFLANVARHSPDFLPGKGAVWYEADGISYHHIRGQYGVLAMIPEGGYGDVTHGPAADTWLDPDRHRAVGRAYAIALWEHWFGGKAAD